MSGENLEQSAGGLQHNAASTDQAVQAVYEARRQMQVFLDDFASRSKGSFVIATHAASVRISEIFITIEDRLTRYAGNNRLLDQDIQAANAEAAARVGGVANNSTPSA